MAEKSNENELREILATLKYLEGQMMNVQNQVNMMERGLMEIGTTKTAISSMKDLKQDTNSLVPLGSGMFAKGTLPKQKTVLVDVGAGTIIEKNFEDADKLLEEREKDLRTNVTNMQQALLNFEKQYNSLAERARSLSG
jgi:prefoldin alpha subunit